MNKYTPDFSVYALQSPEELCSFFSTDQKTGLSTQDAQNNKRAYGANAIQLPVIRWWNMLWNQFSSPFVLIFLGLSGASVLLGEITNALLILSCVLINISFGFFQEYSTSRAMALLQKYLISYVKVIRDGVATTVPSQQLVAGDLIIINAGDRLFADTRIIHSTNLMIDESALTGESIPVHKIADTLTNNGKTITIYEAQNIAFSGTTVTNGNGYGIIYAVGDNTVLGTTLMPAQEELRESGMAQDMKTLSTFLIKLIAVTLVCVLIAHLFIKGTQNYIDILIFATALAVSVIPEALPIVITFCLSSGAAKLAKKKVLSKRLSAVEDLGTVEVLCTDKTGTLTENKTVLVARYDSEPHNVIIYAALASEFVDADNTIHHARDHRGSSVKGFDAAIHQELTPEIMDALDNYERLESLPYDPERKLNSVLVKNNKSEHVLIVRGMHEDVIPLCHTVNMREIDEWIAQENVQGYRIIAVGIRSLDVPDPKEIPDLQNYERDLTLTGLLAFDDPLKPTTRAAIETGKKLGLHIKILSGDNSSVCFSVAHQLDLVKDESDILTGDQFMALNNSEQVQAVHKHSIFARCLPAHKLRIIQLLQQTHRVAYLGDGINDIPALKIAHVSMAVQDAMDVTRDMVDIILLEKSLMVIIDGIKEGRKIVTNTLKYIETTLANNFGNLYAVAIVSLFIDYLPILPIHIILINVLTDLPFIAISTDNVDDDALKTPRHYSPYRITTFVLIIGLVGNLFDVILYGVFRTMPPHVIQMAWYVQNMLTELVLIFSTRTTKVFFKARRPSTTLIVLSIVAFFMAIAPFYTHLGRAILKLPPLSAQHFLWVVGIVIGYFTTVEIVKHYYYAYTKSEK